MRELNDSEQASVPLGTSETEDCTKTTTAAESQEAISKASGSNGIKNLFGISISK